ncbi:porin family protein [Methylocapsa polymorpha]|uniref:Porin family protein n=1 Tax=Methylocapsa polymorpha TaxID=3080828 RepID=A0ABZ0HT03_9HYPH|nr:porin family protein [Methylocapsa sp. RX1]
MIRKLLLASVGAVALAGSALAADLPSRAPPPVYVPPVPIFTWTGVYIGGQIGYAWGNFNNSWGDGFGSFGGFSDQANGVIGGAHVGYNLQLGQWVVGLEGDVDGSSLSRNNNNRTFFDPALGAFVSGNINTNLDIQGSIRGRVGVAWDRVLLYGTGGVAFGGFHTTFNPFFTVGGAFGSGSANVDTTRVGWTVGGGLEYAVTNNWSVRAEYRYTDFGHTTWDPAFAFDNGIFIRRHVTENRVQVGFSYKFDTYAPAPVVAKY